MPWFEITERFRGANIYLVKAEDATEASETYGLRGELVGSEEEQCYDWDTEEIGPATLKERWGKEDV